MRRLAAAAALLLGLAGCTRAAVPPRAAALGYAPGEVHRLEIPRDGMPRVEVAIEGRRVWLLLDTANMTGLFLDARLVHELGLATAGHWTPYDAEGRPGAPRPIFGVRRLAAFGRAWTDVRAYERSEPGLDGAIGPRYLEGARTTLDPRGKWLAVSWRPGGADTSAGAIPLVPARCCPGMPVVRGTVGGRPVLIQLDTGKTRTCIEPALAREWGLARAANGYVVPDVRIGGLAFRVPDARAEGFAGLDTGTGEPIGLGIGSDLLDGVVWTMDARRGTVRLSR